jgi:hypothetical protein
MVGGGGGGGPFGQRGWPTNRLPSIASVGFPVVAQLQFGKLRYFPVSARALPLLYQPRAR